MKRTDEMTSARRMVVTDDQCRCGCGSLLARVVHDGLELKCRKCKSLILIEHHRLVDMYKALQFDPMPTIKPPFRRV